MSKYASLSSLKVCTWNCRGINNKYFELKLFLQTYNEDVLLASERTPAPIIFFIAGYYTYQSDHPSDRRKGGSALFVKNNLSHEDLPPIREDKFQIASIRVYFNNLKCHIGSFYLAPANKLISSNFGNISHLMGSRFLLGGNLNFKHSRRGSNLINPRGRILDQSANKLSLAFIYPTELTYFSDNLPHVLDFFVGKHISGICCTCNILTQELSSDHHPVITIVN